MPFRILSGLLGAFFFVQGVNWIFDAQGAAEGLGMPLLDGMARSTQAGDLTGFFLCLGGFGLYGAYSESPTWLRAAGFLLRVSARVLALAVAAPIQPHRGVPLPRKRVCTAAKDLGCGLQKSDNLKGEHVKR